jgi:hypothetical protein
MLFENFEDFNGGSWGCISHMMREGDTLRL